VIPGPPTEPSSPPPSASLSEIERQVLRQRLFSPLRLSVQIIGFLGGAALVAWCAYIAIARANWHVVLEADPRLLASIGACSLVSILCNGAIFWVSGRAIARVGLVEMQAVNAFACVLNYAPVRLGAIARIVYGVRLSRMSVPAIAWWFSFIGAGVGIVAIAGGGAALLAGGSPTAIAALWVAGVVVGMALLRRCLRGPLARRSRSLQAIAASPAAIWGVAALRLADQLAWVGRMHATILVLGLPLRWSDSVSLAAIAILVSMNPLGRFGYREMAVAWLASFLATSAIAPAEIRAVFFQLALIESVGEALITVPLGIVGAAWVAQRLRRGAAESRDAAPPAMG
jgi:hypothetical protein